MSKGKKILFVFLLVTFIGASVFMSFNMISRPTYEFSYKENYNGTGLDGYVFDGFNGNSGTRDVHIDHPYKKVNGEWVQDKTADVVAVDSYTFVADEYVQYIHIGPSVEYIADEAFVYCKQLRAVYVDENNPNYTDIDGVLYTKDLKTIILYPICRCTQLVYDDIAAYGDVKNIGLDVKEEFTVKGATQDELFADIHSQVRQKNGDDFTRELFDEMLEKGVTAPYIGTYYVIREKTADSLRVEKAWSCDEKYTIPAGVEHIAPKAFYKCDRLISIDIPQGVRTIGNMAFFKCYATSLLTLPDGLETIGNDAFSYCENMRYAVFIPASVKEIGHHAFYKCSNDLLYYMGHKSGDEVELGGRWQARSDNSFKADEPLWGKTREECDKYNSELYARDAEAAANQTSEGNASSASAGQVNTKYIKYIIIFFFAPGFIFIGVQVIRALFKEDFLMTARGKRNLEERKAEREKIRLTYVEGSHAEAQQNEDETDESGADEEEGGDD